MRYKITWGSGDSESSVLWRDFLMFFTEKYSERIEQEFPNEEGLLFVNASENFLKDRNEKHVKINLKDDSARNMITVSFMEDGKKHSVYGPAELIFNRSTFKYEGCLYYYEGKFGYDVEKDNFNIEEFICFAVGKKEFIILSDEVIVNNWKKAKVLTCSEVEELYYVTIPKGIKE